MRIRIDCTCCQLTQYDPDRDGAIPTICDACYQHRGSRDEVRLARTESHEEMLRKRLTASRESERKAREQLEAASAASANVCDTYEMTTVDPPPGYHSVTPRMVVADVAGAVGFLREVFDATGELHIGRPAEMRVGDSLVMVTQAGERELFPAFLYVYVDDADLTYDRAVAAGAVTLEEPLDTPYGDRRAMVSDRWGNIFQVAHRRITP